MERTRSAVALGEVAERLRAENLLVSAKGDAEVHGITDNSRSVEQGDLFCAWRGEAVDAHEFIPEATKAGAAAVLAEHDIEDQNLPLLIATDGRRAASVAASVVLGDPQENLCVVGITGTNGKTTSVWLLRHLLSAKYRTAALGTLGVYLPDGQKLEGSERLTTPGPVDLIRTLRSLVDGGAEAVAMEVSSHALDQGRVHAINYDVAVFTNLTRDHLDYHGTEEAYLAAKLRLAEQLRENGHAVINARVAQWAGVRSRAKRVLSFGVETEADLQASHIIVNDNGTRFVCTYQSDVVPVQLPLLGAYNVENALGALGACVALGMDLRVAAAKLADVPQVPGRLERIATQPCTVLRDYAHTPDALERVLQVLRPLTRGRLILVFGAGGDRDPGKRPLMGAVAHANADALIVTSDNPRTENPDAIIEQILAGIPEERRQSITDRRAAILFALGIASRGDVLLLAGKGHETYQVLGTTKVPFDEKQIVQELLAGAGGAA
jgi:UDP-N-acetylmuramoyl-L-alanyl-D-glutamate--2,6-diaminopimelate ligase